YRPPAGRQCLERSAPRTNPTSGSQWRVAPGGLLHSSTERPEFLRDSDGARHRGETVRLLSAIRLRLLPVDAVASARFQGESEPKSGWAAGAQLRLTQPPRR